MQVDPLAGERDWINPFNFTKNNPINRVDPSGKVDDDFYFKTDGSTTVILNESENRYFEQVVKEDGSKDYEEIDTNTRKGLENLETQLTGRDGYPLLIIGQNEKASSEQQTAAMEAHVKNGILNLYNIMADVGITIFGSLSTVGLIAGTGMAAYGLNSMRLLSAAGKAGTISTSISLAKNTGNLDWKGVAGDFISFSLGSVSTSVTSTLSNSAKLSGVETAAIRGLIDVKATILGEGIARGIKR